MKTILAPISDNGDIAHIREKSMVTLMKTVMASRFSSDIEPIIEKYFGHVAASEGQGAVCAAADIVSHAQFSCPTVNFVKAFVRPSMTAYVYELSQQPSYIGRPKWVRPTHADDIVFSLDSTFTLKFNATEADVRATENFIRIVSSFIHSG